jgi:integrase
MDALRRTPHAALFAQIALYTGLRHRAIVDLTWGQVDLENKLITSNPAGRPQTRKARPTVPICDGLLEILKFEHGRRRCEYVVSFRKRRVKDGSRAIVAGLTTAASAQLNSLEFVLREDHRQALIQSAARLNAATPHTFRHTFLTWLDRAGVSREEQMKFVGHTQARTTETYVHVSSASMAPIVDKLELIAREVEIFFGPAAAADNEIAGSLLDHQA